MTGISLRFFPRGQIIRFSVWMMSFGVFLFILCASFHDLLSKNQISASYEKNSLNFGEIINYFNQNNIKIEDISTDDGDFEDVFVQLTKH